MDFDRWFRNVDIETTSIKNLCQEAYDTGFEMGEGQACEGAWQDGWDAGVVDTRQQMQNDVDIASKEAYREGHEEGFKLGLVAQKEDVY